MSEQPVPAAKAPVSRQQWIVRGVLVAGALLAITIGILPPNPRKPLVESPEFQTALKQASSGQPTRLPGGVVVTPIASFTTADGRICRGYRLSGNVQDSGIGCLDDGEWIITRHGSTTQSGANPLDAAAEQGAIAHHWVQDAAPAQR